MSSDTGISSELASNVNESRHDLNEVLELLREIELPENERLATDRIIEVMSGKGYGAEPVSYKRGFNMVLIEIDSKRYIVWIRSSPISRNALRIAESIVSKYEIDGKILVKLKRRADYVRVSGWTKL